MDALDEIRYLKSKINDLCAENAKLHDARVAAIEDHALMRRTELGCTDETRMALFVRCDGKRKLYFRENGYPGFAFAFYCSREYVVFLDSKGYPVKHMDVHSGSDSSQTLCFSCRHHLENGNPARDREERAALIKKL